VKLAALLDSAHVQRFSPSSLLAVPFQTLLETNRLRDRQSGQLQSLQTSLCRSPIAGAKFTNLSLQITPYKEDGKKYSSLFMLVFYAFSIIM